jgi:hypothetical protein
MGVSLTTGIKNQRYSCSAENHRDEHIVLRHAESIARRVQQTQAIRCVRQIDRARQVIFRNGAEQRLKKS